MVLFRWNETLSSILWLLYGYRHWRMLGDRPLWFMRRQILEQFGLLDCNQVNSPMEPKLKVKKDENSEKLEPIEYMWVMGCLSYLTRSTRPYLSYTVEIAGRFMKRPAKFYFQVIKQILRYVKIMFQLPSFIECVWISLYTLVIK